MALNTFNPPVAPSPGTAKKTKAKLLKAGFGDGYTQYAADGTNWIKADVTLTWDILLPSDAETIENFLIGQGGYIPFYYTLSDDPSPTRWTCEEWTIERKQGGLRKVTMPLIQYLGVLT